MNKMDGSELSVSMTALPRISPHETVSDTNRFYSECMRHLAHCSSYFPRHMPSIPPVGSSVFLNGCCLLVDMCGFTELSNKHFAKGLKGIDKLRVFMNKSLARIVDLVYEQRGDVIKFAGDSLLCVFPSRDDGDKHDCIMRAVRCGLDIVHFHIDEISIRAGMSYGKMCFAVLGGHNDRCSTLLNGYCIDECGECLAVAGAHELVITDEVYKLIEGTVVGDPVADVYVRITHTDGCSGKSSGVDTDSLTFPELGGDDILKTVFSCIPFPVIKSLASNIVSELSEIRTVTALFLKVDSYRTQDFENLSDMQSLFLPMLKCLNECGGFLRQFIVDEKGCVLIGLWGVPTASHAANCSKALRCAVMMKNEASSQLHSVSVGITTGSAYCGTIGTDYRRDYTAIGSTINLAARLMNNATGRVVMDDITYQRLPLNVACRCDLTEPIRRRGMTVGVPHYYYASSALPNAFVWDLQADFVVVIESYIKRTIQMVMDQNSTKALQQIRSTTLVSPSEDSLHSPAIIVPRNSPTPSTVLLISGTSGAGKTATMHYFMRRYQHQFVDSTSAGTVCVTLTANDQPAFCALRQLADSLFTFLGRDSLHSRVELLKEKMIEAFASHSVGYIAGRLYPVVKVVLGLSEEWNVDDTRIQTAQLTQKSDEEILVAVFSQIIGTAVKLLCIDNIHFMCPTCWKVLSGLCIKGHPGLVVLSLRVKSSGHIENFDPLLYNESEVTREAFTSHRTSARGSDTQDNDLVPSRRVAEFVWFNQSISECRLLELHLKPMSQTTVGLIIESEVPGALSPSYLSTVYNICRGNPSVLWRIIEYFNESDCLNLTELIERVKDNSVLAFSLENANQSHVSIIKHASVIGEEFSTDQLKSILPPQLCDAVDNAMQSFVDRGTIVPLCDEYYSFISYFMRSMFYKLLPKSDAVAIHTRIAGSIRQMFSASWPSFDYSFCYHCSMSMMKAHRRDGLQHCCFVVGRYLQKEEVEATVTFFEFALVSVYTSGDRRRVLGLLLRAIDCGRRKMMSCETSESGSIILVHTLAKLEHMYHCLRSRMNLTSHFMDCILNVLFNDKKRNQIFVSESFSMK